MTSARDVKYRTDSTGGRSWFSTAPAAIDVESEQGEAFGPWVCPLRSLHRAQRHWREPLLLVAHSLHPQQLPRMLDAVHKGDWGV